MWRRLRRRTFGPSRPALLAEQWGLALVTLAAVAGGVAIVAVLLGAG
ncbi:MAG: hypothetical protein H0T19_03350 [Thermoleophilaceae bacterium]|nr:hypothetical protein [Thermoleophilaceae bacterium]